MSATATNTSASTASVSSASTNTRVFFPVEGERLALNRPQLEEVMRQRGFVIPAFQIYGGIAGLYDYGPPGSAVKNNLVNLWRNHFIIHDSMLEVDCTCLTPKVVLDWSGHTAKFSDYMVRDVVTKTCYRADHVLKGHVEGLIAEKNITEEKKKELETFLARIDDLKGPELAESLKKFKVRAPDTDNELTDPQPFNLMFQTSIGPAGDVVGFMRPETAQGIFVNFKKLLEFNGGHVPFAAAQVGQAFRNEIAPRSGLLRVREFTLAEIEYFVNPHEKTHYNYKRHVVDACSKLPLLSAPRQMEGASVPIFTEVATAVKEKIIGNEALGYFMTRTFLFLRECGIPEQHIRFRQHLRSEMAHYASDCWDAEIRTSYGWIECVGHADRTCFDLSQHTTGSKTSLTAYEPFKDGSKLVEKHVIRLDKGALGKQFKKDAQPLMQYMESLSQEAIVELEKKLKADGKISVTADGKTFELDAKLAQFALVQEKVTGETFTPHVIEPSFGIGRIFYCIMEHAYWCRPNDKDRGVFSLPPILAPCKVSVFPLLNDERFSPFVEKIDHMLSMAGISHKVDETGTAIGRRYARTDEIGIPFAITVDHTTLTPGTEGSTVTLRERDTCAQIRIPISSLVDVLLRLSSHTVSWTEIQSKFPAVEVKE